MQEGCERILTDQGALFVLCEWISLKYSVDVINAAIDEAITSFSFFLSHFRSLSLISSSDGVSVVLPGGDCIPGNQEHALPGITISAPVFKVSLWYNILAVRTHGRVRAQPVWKHLCCCMLLTPCCACSCSWPIPMVLMRV